MDYGGLSHGDVYLKLSVLQHFTCYVSSYTHGKMQSSNACDLTSVVLRILRNGYIIIDGKGRNDGVQVTKDTKLQTKTGKDVATHQKEKSWGSAGPARLGWPGLAVPAPKLIALSQTLFVLSFPIAFLPLAGLANMGFSVSGWHLSHWGNWRVAFPSWLPAPHRFSPFPIFMAFPFAIASPPSFNNDDQRAAISIFGLCCFVLI